MVGVVFRFRDEVLRYSMNSYEMPDTPLQGKERSICKKGAALMKVQYDPMAKSIICFLTLKTESFTKSIRLVYDTGFYSLYLFLSFITAVDWVSAAVLLYKQKSVCVQRQYLLHCFLPLYVRTDGSPVSPGFGSTRRGWRSEAPRTSACPHSGTRRNRSHAPLRP